MGTLLGKKHCDINERLNSERFRVAPRTGRSLRARLRVGKPAARAGRNAMSGMKRRDFVALLGGAAAAGPLSARAQQHMMSVIGFLIISGAVRPIVPRNALRSGHYCE